MTTPTPPMPVTADAEAALRYCRDITRRRARNFYYGLKLLPEPKRSALYSVYAWMRRADDLVDERETSANCVQDMDALEAFATQTRQTMQAARNGQPIDEQDPLWHALAFTARHYPVSAAHFESLLDGQRDDLNQRSYASFSELQEYCKRVASTVGLICIEVWGYDDPRAPQLAIKRGIAFQLTNIIRDFTQDFDDGRVYLPADELKAAGLDAAGLRNWQDTDACMRFLYDQIERAERFYVESAALDEMISVDCRPTLWAMTGIYQGLLHQAGADPRRVIRGPRLRLSSWNKASIAFRARRLARTSAGRSIANGRAASTPVS